MFEPIEFLYHFGQSTLTVGALTPTWQPTARALTSELARRDGPRRILEVGSGTGAVTLEIARLLRPGDQLMLFELQPEFAASLRRRLREDPILARHAGQIVLCEGTVLDLDPALRFDFIVSTLPFVNLEAQEIDAILDVYERALAPGGVLSYLEYAHLRVLKRPFQSPESRARADAAAAVLARRAAPGQFRRDVIARNIPPAWVHHVRFGPAAVEEALRLAPLEHRHRWPLFRGLGIASQAGLFLGPLVAFAILAFEGGWPVLAVLVALLAVAVGGFFRDPERAVPRDPALALAPADGRVLAIERLADDRLGPGEWLRVAIFLSVLDVHVNRSPVAGRVVRQIDQAGGYGHAGREGAAGNASRYTLIEGVHGPAVVAQRVGAIARRIVTWVRPGELLAQGDRYGLIRFGSRTDLYLPAGRWAPLVAPGDTVRGGLTALARCSDPWPR